MSAHDKAFKKSEFHLIPEDSYTAKIYSLIDIGDHETNFDEERVNPETGQKEKTGRKKIASQLSVTFELQPPCGTLSNNDDES